MRADIQTFNSITTLSDDCVASIVKNITEDADHKSPVLLSPFLPQPHLRLCSLRHFTQ